MFGKPGVLRVVLCGLVLLLAVVSCAVLLDGLLGVWPPKGDILTRAHELGWLYRGIYPHDLVDPAYPSSLDDDVANTPYPPWSLSILSLLFFPGGASQAVILVTVLSLLVLVFLASLFTTAARRYGALGSVLAILLPFAIAGHANSLAQAQLGILSFGLAMLELVCLRRHRPRLAGVCWAAAMVKPQIALMFLVPLLSSRWRSGLRVGLGSVALLFVAPFVHAQVNPWMYLHSVAPMFLVYFSDDDPSALGSVLMGALDTIQLAGQVPLLCQLLLLLAAVVLLLRLLGFPVLTKGFSISTSGLIGLPAMVVYSVLPVLLLYHRGYDNIRLVLLLFYYLMLFLGRPSRFSFGALLMLLFTLATPQRFLDLIPHVSELQRLLWTAFLILPAFSFARACVPGVPVPAWLHARRIQGGILHSAWGTAIHHSRTIGPRAPRR